MAALTQFMDMFKGLRSSSGIEQNLPGSGSSFQFALEGPNGRVFRSVVVGMFIFVFAVGLLGYSLKSIPSQNEADSVRAGEYATETVDFEETVTEPTTRSEAKVVDSQDEPSLSSESGEQIVPKLRRSARIREREFRASKKDS